MYVRCSRFVVALENDGQSESTSDKSDHRVAG
jgi:hypothetical protein